MTTIRPVILAGGVGSRLHPLSNPEKPKQFLSLLDEDSPFQDTLERISGPEFLPPLIIANETEAVLVQEQCDDIAFDYEELLLEVEGRNTAAACLAAALWAKGRGENYPLLICPCDHYVADQYAFMRAVNDAAHTAEQGYLVTFGVVADRPEMAYGYIEVGTRIDVGYSGHRVGCFIEKPTREKAQSMLDEGCYVWNAGIFCTTPDLLISEIVQHTADLMIPVEGAIKNGPVLDYGDCPHISLDKAVAEKTDKMAVVSLLSAWSDLGTWPGLWKALSLKEI